MPCVDEFCDDNDGIQENVVQADAQHIPCNGEEKVNEDAYNHPDAHLLHSIHNLYLENPCVFGTDYTGAVLGYCNNYTRVSDVLVTSNAGNGDFTVRATGSAGGIVGFVKNGVIEHCYFEGRVWSHQGWAGGIVGHMQNGKVEDCAAGSYVANLLNSDNWRLGGIVGGTYGSYTPGQVNVTINRCLAWSNFIIEGNYSPGEQMSYSGWILGYANVPTEITNCAYYVDPDNAVILSTEVVPRILTSIAITTQSMVIMRPTRPSTASWSAILSHTWAMITGTTSPRALRTIPYPQI